MAMGKSEVTEKSKVSSKKKDKDILPTKIVLRRLPASLTEDELKRILARGPELDFFRFVPADYSLLQHAFSRAYINFKRFEDLALFRNAFDGFIFNAGKGDESSAVVEIAPFQGIPKEGRKRKDPKCGSISNDPDYEAFLENLSKKIEPFPSAEAFVEQMELSKAASATEKVQTPLTEFLNKKKAARNLSRQNAALLESERKMKREKEMRESSKSKNDEKLSGKDSRKDRSESKGSQEKRNAESKRKDERRERRTSSSKKSKSDSKDQKKANFEEDRLHSARADGSKRSEGGRISKREERRHTNDRRGRNATQDERRNRDEKRDKDETSQRKTPDLKKSTKSEGMNDEEKRPRRKSIEYEDPSIVSFGKSVEAKDPDRHGGKGQWKDGTRGKEEENRPRQRGGEAGKGKESTRSETQTEDGERKVRNKERPEMAVYRPPVARQDRGKGKGERPSPDKGRIKSPSGVKSPEKKERTHDRGFQKDRSRFGQKDQDNERNKEKEKRVREQERREREKRREKEKERKDDEGK